MRTVFLITALLISCRSQATSEKSPDVTFNDVLNELDSLVHNTSPGNELIRTRFDYVLNKIKSREVVIVYDSLLKYSIDSCSSFGRKKDSSAMFIGFGPFFVDLYPQNRSTAYAILIHEFQHAYDYYTNREGYEIGLTNPIEKEYFEVDAMALEAYFVRDYLKDYPISPSEQYLSENLSWGMQGAALFLTQTDLELLHEIDRIKDGPKDWQSSVNDFISIGKSITDTTVFSGNRPFWMNYMSLVRLVTYVWYGSQVSYDIVHFKDSRVNSLSDYSLANYPAVKSTILEAQNKMFANIKYLRFQDTVYANYNSYFIENMKKK